MKKFYTSSFNVIKGAEAVQNARVFSIATKVPADCADMKTIPELAPGWDIVGPYKSAEKNGSDMAEAQKVYEKAYWNNILKNLSPDIIPDGAILCCYENSSKFCHRQTVARWATWADTNVEYGGELDTAKKVFDVINAEVQTDLNFEEEENEMTNNTDTIVTTVNTVVKNNTEKKETIEMKNIEAKAAEVREAINAAGTAELAKIEATKKYIALRDAARAAMAIKRVATCKHQIANANVRLLKAEFSVIEINGKIEAAVEVGKTTAALEKRLAKAQERVAKAQERIAVLEEKLAGLTENAPEAATVVEEQAIETPAIEKPVEPATVEELVIEETTADKQLFDHINNIEIAVNWIAKKAAMETLHAELDELDKERIAEGDLIEKDDPVVENDDELDLIVETEDDSEEPEEVVSFAAPKIVKADGLLTGKTVVGTVEEPAETTTAAAVTTSLQEIIAKRATVVAAPVPAVKQETAPAPAAPKTFVHVNPFKKESNVSVAAPVAKTASEEDGWVINDPIEFDEEIERDLGRNPDGTKKTWGTWVLEQQAEEIGDFDCLNLETGEDGMIIMPDQPVDQWLIHGATGTKDKKKNFRDSFLNNDVYDDIKLENAYNFGDENCTNYEVIMDEIYG